MNLNQLSTTQLEDLTKIDRRTIKKKLAHVDPIKGPRGALMYEPHVVLPILYGLGSDDPAEADRALQAARLRHEEARADKVRLEADILAKDVVPIEDVTKAVAKEYTYVRATLYSMPTKLATALAREDDPSKVQAMLHAGVDEALAHLQADTNLEETITSIEEEEKAETTNEA